MSKRIYFNAFQMNCVVHQSPGLWTRNDDHMVDYKRLDHWMNFAKLIERGCFDAIFLADVLSVYDVYGANRDAALRARDTKAARCDRLRARAGDTAALKQLCDEAGLGFEVVSPLEVGGEVVSSSRVRAARSTAPTRSAAPPAHPSTWCTRSRSSPSWAHTA